MMNDPDIKKAITRFIKLNQPTSLKVLLTEFQEIEESGVIDLLIYLHELQTKDTIKLIPNIFDKDWFDEYNNLNIHKLSLEDFKSGTVKVDIIIPNYISYLWKRWNIKRILGN